MKTVVRASLSLPARRFAARVDSQPRRARCRTDRRRRSTIPTRALPTSETSSPAVPPPTPSPPSPAAETTCDASASTIGAPELSLLFTAFLWGSYSPALRFLFELPQPPSVATLTSARAVLQAALLLAFAAGSSLFAPDRAADSPAPSSGGGGRDERPRREPLPSDLSPLAKLMRTPAPSLALAGAELGFWNLSASAFHAAGLSRTSATEAAFVVCATGLLTPLYSSLAGERQGNRVWGGCGVALAGALALSLDKALSSGGGGASPPVPLSTSLEGDGLVLCAACFYAAATFRLSVLAPVFASGDPPSPPSSSSGGPQALAAAKSVAFAVGAVAWALSSGALLAPAAEGGIGTLVGGGALATAPLVLAWASLGPGALAAFLQARGQAKVKASRAQALFATVPLWSAVIAGALLGERIGPAGWVGGLLIVAGGAFAATAPKEAG